MKAGAPFLCLDLGFKRTGVALSESGLVAKPLTVVTTDYPHLNLLLTQVVKLVQEYSIATIVVGMPNNMDDSTTKQAERVEALVEELKSALQSTGLMPEFVPYNEFGTTAAGKQRFPDLDDNIAAATILLDEYLQEAA